MERKYRGIGGIWNEEVYQIVFGSCLVKPIIYRLFRKLRESHTVRNSFGDARACVGYSDGQCRGDTDSDSDPGNSFF